MMKGMIIVGIILGTYQIYLVDNRSSRSGSVRAAQAKEELLWTALAPQPREEEKSISYL